MYIGKKALYNLLRLNWLEDPSIEVEPWQVEDYRLLSEETLFERLKEFHISLDRKSFVAYAENSESPEELAESFVGEKEWDIKAQDQMFLLVFELWRRLMIGGHCLSVFCDEVDYQIGLYDHEEAANAETMENLLGNLEEILNENADQGVDPIEVFESLTAGCANDVESFLYDFISDQVDDDNLDYASDLIESFYDFVRDVRWFDFLKVRVLARFRFAEATEALQEIIQDLRSQPSVELSLEILGFLSHQPPVSLFFPLVRQTLSQLQSEQDFQDLLRICVEQAENVGLTRESQLFQDILAKRATLDPEAPLSERDDDRLAVDRLLS